METVLSWFGVEVDLAHSWYLLTALAIVPALWWSRRAAGRVTFSSLDALPDSSTWRTRFAWLPDALIALAIMSLAVALSGPRTGDRDSKVRAEGIAIMMVVDISGSMQALDLSEPNQEMTRLDAVKQVFERFVLGGEALAGRGDDAVGLVSFAGYADTRSPLTLDHGNLVAAVRALELVSDPKEDGTAVGDGLALAVERLRESKQASKVAILLTDGVSNRGEVMPLAAATLARDAGVKVYTIGAGTNGMAPVKATDPFTGEPRLVSTRVEIDEETLRAIAAKANGQYFRATDAAGLRKVYGEIDKLEKTEVTEVKFLEHHLHYEWFVAAAMLAFALALALRASVFRRLP